MCILGTASFASLNLCSSSCVHLNSSLESLSAVACSSVSSRSAMLGVALLRVLYRPTQLLMSLTFLMLSWLVLTRAFLLCGEGSSLPPCFHTQPRMSTC